MCSSDLPQTYGHYISPIAGNNSVAIDGPLGGPRAGHKRVTRASCSLPSRITCGTIKAMAVHGTRTKRPDGENFARHESVEKVLHSWIYDDDVAID